MNRASDSTTDQPINELRALDREARLLEHVAATLSWDQETYMPARAVDERAEQQALIQTLVHERNTAPRVAELLSRCNVDLDATRDAGLPSELSEYDRAFVREKRRQYQHATRLPARLVREMAETASRGQNAWIGARKADDYELFKPWLKKLIALNRETADALGYDGVRYDALLDQYEPYARTDEVTAVFKKLRDGLVPLVHAIAEKPQPDVAFLDARFPVEKQEHFSERVMVALGYDLERGRLDRSAHPFTTTLGGHDVRITTRYDEKLLFSALFSTIHETGHALYELGIDDVLHGTLLAEGTSLGIHESQSRMWENMIGRSRSFWNYWLPAMHELFPTELGGVGIDQFYRAANRVQPSLIRVEADEVTYSLHIILRFELEQRLISGDLDVDDLPEAWNAASRELLGIVPPNFAQGVMQDVHWSFGAFGYFPTYALGNLYAAQFMTVMEQQIPDMWRGIAQGETAPVLEWLRTNIHSVGRARSAADLVTGITGAPLDPAHFLAYLQEKYGEIYRL